MMSPKHQRDVLSSLWCFSKTCKVSMMRIAVMPLCPPPPPPPFPLKLKSGSSAGSHPGLISGGKVTSQRSCCFSQAPWSLQLKEDETCAAQGQSFFTFCMCVIQDCGGVCVSESSPCSYKQTDYTFNLCPLVCILCVDVKQVEREIGRSSLVAGKWGDLFFGSFPEKFPGDRDTENIYLYTHYVLHKREGEAERRSGDV